MSVLTHCLAARKKSRLIGFVTLRSLLTQILLCNRRSELRDLGLKFTELTSFAKRIRLFVSSQVVDLIIESYHFQLPRHPVRGCTFPLRNELTVQPKKPCL